MIQPNNIIDFENVTSTNLGGGGSTSNVNNSISFDSYVIRVDSNEVGAQIMINGVNSGKTTPSNISIGRSELINYNKEIEVIKEGYSTGEKYIVSLTNPNGATIIKRQNDILGLSQTQLSIEYYNNGTKQTYSDSSVSNLKSITFSLTKKTKTNLTETPTQYTLKVNVTGEGNPVSILKNSTKSAEFFPTIGNNIYLDVSGTDYKIQSSDTSLYRITEILVSTTSSVQKPLIADANESLILDIKLLDSYTISITTEGVVKPRPSLNPQIKLLKSDSRTYNINSKLGVPIAFEKNAAVQAVTVMVGNDVLEFDDLEAGPIGGITIPHSVFEKIGKYGVKMFPFSLNDYENQVRPAENPIQIKTKPIVWPTIIKEEVVKETPTKPDIYNPYVPTSGGGSGGGGATYFYSDLDNDTFGRQDQVFTRESPNEQSVR